MAEDNKIHDGYVLLARIIEQSPIWRDDPHVLKLFIYFVMEARHSKQPQRYPGFEVKRGELITSLGQISNDNQYYYRTVKKWSRSKVSRMIERLERQGYIKVLADTYGTHIKICNYYTYQDTANYKRTVAGQHRNSSGTEVDINNNDNNDKNDKNDKRKTSFIKPSLQQIQEYCESKKHEIDPANFYDFYESKGWMVGKNKMKDWKAAVRNWERSDTLFKKPGKKNGMTSHEAWHKAMDVAKGKLKLKNLPDEIKKAIKFVGGSRVIGDSRADSTFMMNAFIKAYEDILRNQT